MREPRTVLLTVLSIALLGELQTTELPEVSAAAPAAAQTKQLLEFDVPPATWDEAIPLADGLMGALVWGDGSPLRISLDRTDLWDLRPVSEFHAPEYDYQTMREWERAGRVEELIKRYEDPYHRPAPTKIPAGRIEIDFDAPFERMELRVEADGAQALVYLQRIEVSVGFDRARHVGIVRWTGTQQSVRLRVPAFGGGEENTVRKAISAGELSQLGYPPPQLEEGEGWSGYTQQGWGDFRFAVYQQQQAREGETLLAWSIVTSHEGPNPLELARQRVQEVLAQQAQPAKPPADYPSRVEVPDPVLQRQYDLDIYKFDAATATPKAPPISLQGPWTADDGKLPPWKGDFHHDLNTQLSYWPCYTGNRLDRGLGYLDWLWSTRGAARDWTQRFFKLPGLNVPMTTDLEGKQIGGWRQYTHSATTAAWLAEHFYRHWRYSMDRAFLEQRAYPYLKEVATFLDAITRERDADGRRTLPLSSSPEIHDNRPEAWFPSITNYDCALIRWVFDKAAELADELGEKNEAMGWRQCLAEMPPLAVGSDGGLLVARDHPLTESHRHLSHLMAIYPLGLIDSHDTPDEARIFDASLAHIDALGTKQWTGYSFAWYAMIQARAGNGEKAAEALRLFSRAFTLRNSFHCNGDQSGEGHSNFTYRPFTLEGNFAAAAALQEMLLQSHRGYIEIFPAIPAAWANAAFENLRTQGAFLVSATRRDGQLQYLRITAEAGGTLRLMLPGASEMTTLQMEPGEVVERASDGTMSRMTP